MNHNFEFFSGMAGSSWPPPLAANTPAHVASALPDPLGALTAGEIPAIVIKRLIQPQLAAALAERGGLDDDEQRRLGVAL